MIWTTEINPNNFIFNIRLGNLDLDFEIRISDFAIKCQIKLNASVTLIPRKVTMHC